MCANILHAPEPLGTISCGGTESIFLALKAYRTWGKNEKNISKPNVIVPESAHPAFVKGVWCLCVCVFVCLCCI